MDKSGKEQPKEFTDAISLLEREHEAVSGMLSELEAVSRAAGRNGMDAEKGKLILKIISSIHEKIFKFFGIEEELLFRELEAVLPEQSSTSVMRREHQLLLGMCGSIKVIAEETDKLNSRSDELQSVIANLIDLLTRHFHKKNSILYFEARTMLPKEVMDKIYSEMCKKI